MSLTHKRNAHHSRFFFSLPCFANFYFCYATLAENYQRERSWRFLSLFYLSSESAHAFIHEFPNKEVYIIFCWCCDVTLGQFELSKEAAIIFCFECFVFLNFFVFLYFIQDRTRNEKKWKKKGHWGWRCWGRICTGPCDSTTAISFSYRCGWRRDGLSNGPSSLLTTRIAD